MKKIFLFEYFTACDPAAPEFLEGHAMLQTLANSFLEIGIPTSSIFHKDCPIPTTRNFCGANFTVRNNPGWVFNSQQFSVMYSEMVQDSDAVLVIAPETNDVLLRLTGPVEKHGKINLGSSTRGIARAQNKYLSYKALSGRGINTPRTYPVKNLAEARNIADRIGYPLVVKPCVGADSRGVYLVENHKDLQVAVAGAIAAKTTASCVVGDDFTVTDTTAARISENNASATGAAAANNAATLGADNVILVQEYIRGRHMSVTVLGGTRTLPISLNEQRFEGHMPFKYRGGKVCVTHPCTDYIFETATLAWNTLGGLGGYGGIDIVFGENRTGEDKAYVIEINPRPTTPLVALNGCIENNLAKMLLGALSGERLDPIFHRWDLPFRIT